MLRINAQKSVTVWANVLRGATSVHAERDEATAAETSAG